MIPEDNILNRFGIFSITEQEFDITEELTKDNWTKFVRPYEPVEIEVCHHRRTDHGVIKRLRERKNLKEVNLHNYVLTHTYDEEPRLYYVTAPYSLDTMNGIIAYIQLECADIKMEFGLDQEEITLILNTFYECELLENVMTDAMEIDLYENWEAWAAPYSDEIQSITQYKRDGLTNFIKDMIEKSK